MRTAPAVLDGPALWSAQTHLPSVVARTEVFGPVAAVQRSTTQAEVLRRANDTGLGLAGDVRTESLDRALDVADALETGLVGFDAGVPSSAAAPFGGVEQSGLGREGSAEGLDAYQEIRSYDVARRAPEPAVDGHHGPATAAPGAAP